jgi:hypothetical protein
LVALLRDDPAQYDRKIARALGPLRVDEDGYSSIPELLEQSRALNFTREPHLRLSDRALARIAIDTDSKTTHRASWVGNRDEGPWHELLSNKALDKVRTEVSALLKNGEAVAAYSRRSFKASDKTKYDSDFQSKGRSEIKAPASLIPCGVPHYVDKKRTARLVLAGLESSNESEDEDAQGRDETTESLASEHESNASDHSEDEDENSGDDTGNKEADDEEKRLPPRDASDGE